MVQNWFYGAALIALGLTVNAAYLANGAGFWASLMVGLICLRVASDVSRGQLR